MEPEEAAVAPAVQESEPSSQSVKKIELDIRTQCPFESITVYTTNQAELTRKVRTKLAKGTNEIVLKNLVTGVDSNSIRVVAGRGKGATILEVRKSRCSKKHRDRPAAMARRLASEPILTKRIFFLQGICL